MSLVAVVFSNKHCAVHTLGRVSTTNMNLDLGFDLRMHCSIASSSTHLALNPARGWELLQMAA